MGTRWQSTKVCHGPTAIIPVRRAHWGLELQVFLEDRGLYQAFIMG